MAKRNGTEYAVECSQCRSTSPRFALVESSFPSATHAAASPVLVLLPIALATSHGRLCMPLPRPGSHLPSQSQPPSMMCAVPFRDRGEAPSSSRHGGTGIGKRNNSANPRARDKKWQALHNSSRKRMVHPHCRLSCASRCGGGGRGGYEKEEMQPVGIDSMLRHTHCNSNHECGCALLVTSVSIARVN